jgi:hypothetical protein
VKSLKYAKTSSTGLAITTLRVMRMVHLSNR